MQFLLLFLGGGIIWGSYVLSDTRFKNLFLLSIKAKEGFRSAELNAPLTPFVNPPATKNFNFQGSLLVFHSLENLV